MSAPRRALIVVDVQNDYFDAEGPLAIQYPPRDESLANIVRVLEAAQQAGLPTAVVQHQYPEGFPVFAEGSEGQKLHADVGALAHDGWKRATKSVASVFPETGLAAWLEESSVDTITLVGYMTNNCILGTAADAEPMGVAVEVLSDSTGAVNLTNAQGSVPAQQVHETLMTLLNSNFAAVSRHGDVAEGAGVGRGHRRQQSPRLRHGGVSRLRRNVPDENAMTPCQVAGGHRVLSSGTFRSRDRSRGQPTSWETTTSARFGALMNGAQTTALVARIPPTMNAMRGAVEQAVDQFGPARGLCGCDGAHDRHEDRGADRAAQLLAGVEDGRAVPVEHGGGRRSARRTGGRSSAWPGRCRRSCGTRR